LLEKENRAFIAPFPMELNKKSPKRAKFTESGWWAMTFHFIR
jgi:hypothetical protein